MLEYRVCENEGWSATDDLIIDRTMQDSVRY